MGVFVMGVVCEGQPAVVTDGIVTEAPCKPRCQGHAQLLGSWTTQQI